MIIIIMLDLSIHVEVAEGGRVLGMLAVYPSSASLAGYHGKIRGIPRPAALAPLSF